MQQDSHPDTCPKGKRSQAEFSSPKSTSSEERLAPSRKSSKINVLDPGLDKTSSISANSKSLSISSGQSPHALASKSSRHGVSEDDSLVHTRHSSYSAPQGQMPTHTIGGALPPQVHVGSTMGPSAKAPHGYGQLHPTAQATQAPAHHDNRIKVPTGSQ